ncbi:MAG: exodeoxyribonuclease VII large subunit [Candidatus Velthaea sp.]
MRAAPALPEYPVVAVNRLANYIARRLGEDPKLRRLGVRGEISGLSVQPNGNVYFDLKDREALVNCVAWSEAAATLPPLENGAEIVAVGSVSTYKKKSAYQLVVLHVEHGGIGRLHAIYEDLKRRLQGEGLFEQARKRPLPRYPFAVGLVSSRSANGAADFLSQAAALAPHVVITLFETPVQGAAAAPDIVRAIERASRAPLDLVVLARGGGSYEDLFVFNDERVVRALARCAHPTVSAIGHEADAPLTDFVADHRAPTPSTAAQTVLPHRAELLRGIGACAAALERTTLRGMQRLRGDLQRIEIRSPLADAVRLLAGRRQAVDVAASDLRRGAEVRLRARAERLRGLERRLAARNPSVQLAKRRERLTLAAYALPRAAGSVIARAGVGFTNVGGRLSPATTRSLEKRAERLRFAELTLQGKDPARILQQGYAIVRAGGRALRDAGEVRPGALISAELARGTLSARVESSAPHGGE